MAIPVVFALLMFSGCTAHKQASGIYVTLLRRGPDPLPEATDQDGLYIMRIQSKDLVFIRNESVRVENLGRRLEEVFRTRIERLLLVKVEGQIEFADLIRVLHAASSQTKLEYGLITARTTPTPAEPSLFLHGEHIYTQYFPLQDPHALQLKSQ